MTLQVVLKDYYFILCLHCRYISINCRSQMGADFMPHMRSVSLV